MHRLEAENERLRNENERFGRLFEASQQVNAALREENERLRPSYFGMSVQFKVGKF